MKKPVLIAGWALSCAGAFGLGALTIKQNTAGTGGAGGNSAGGTLLTAGGESSSSSDGPKVPGGGTSSGSNSGDPFAAFVRDGEVSPEEMTTVWKTIKRTPDKYG
jgi:hypothetical protein